MKDIFDLKNKVAIVTGGYGYLGRAMVEALLGFNARVVVAGRSEEKFYRSFGKKENDSLIFKNIDITSSDSIDHCFSEVLNGFGSIDILVNNAHTARGHSQFNMTDEDWIYTMEGVVGSVHKTIRAVIPVMKKQRSGKIINIASMYGIISPDFRLYEGENCEIYTNPPHYGAAKAAMIQLTKYYGVLLGNSNIQVNALSPGPFPKQEIQDTNPEFVRRLREKNPLRRIGKPGDLSGAIILLSSRGSDFMTGQTIQVDGGWTIW